MHRATERQRRRITSGSRRRLAFLVVAATTLLAPPAQADIPEPSALRYTSPSVFLDLGLRNAAVCIIRPASRRVAEHCGGIEIAAAESTLPPDAELAVWVREGPRGGERAWLLTGVVAPYRTKRVLSIQDAAKLAEAARARVAATTKRTVVSFGEGPELTHALHASRGGLFIRQRLEIAAPAGSDEPPTILALATLGGRDDITTLTVRAISPPTVDVEQALTKVLARATITPPDGPKEWQSQAHLDGYYTGRLTERLCLWAPAPVAAAGLLVAWLVQRRRTKQLVKLAA